jgi:hypothetical protein
MTLLLLSYVNITPTSILIRPGVSVSFPLFLVRLTVYIVNLSEFYSYRIIGKLTVFIHQELCLLNQIVDFSTTTMRFFLLCSNLGLEISLSRLQTYVLTSILNDHQSRLSLTFTLHTRKLLRVYDSRDRSYHPVPTRVRVSRAETVLASRLLGARDEPHTRVDLPDDQYLAARTGRRHKFEPAHE